ncbi:MAG: carbamoyltransferase C-terminal domain-containing protein [Pseudomonadota bacterium]
MIIVGLNAYHGDSAACLVRDGQIMAAAEEERFRRIKHWAGFPSEAIKYCLSEIGACISDVDIVAVNSNPRASLLKKVEYTVRQRPDYRFVLDRLRNQKKRQSIENEINSVIPGKIFRGRFERIEHHTAHLASAFLVSPFREAAIASIDGFGDFSSAAWGSGRGTTLEVEDRVYFPHSLGVFYQALTQYLGFPYYGDEYKVMGLAPYGRPCFASEMRKIVKLKEGGRFELELKYFRHHKEKIEYGWDGGAPHVGTLFAAELEHLLGPARGKNDELTERHRDIARSVQAMYEEAFFNLLEHLYQTYQLDRIALAGGCAMNSVANGKVLRRSKFKRLYVQSAAGDAGGALGAAIYAWHNQQTDMSAQSDPAPGPRSPLAGDQLEGRVIMDHAYYGPKSDDADIAALLEERANDIASDACVVSRIPDYADLCRRTANTISEGKVVGWFQGRLEWGPRALGNRSIVCDPRRPDMKDILNRKIKRRESFRPFAPSILHECVGEWFEENGDVPFMMQVYQIREDKRSLIPAVTHVDGSGRLQSVYRETNPLYWQLISAFNELSGVPMVLNTSFNENEPVVCRPCEALDCFLRTQMDELVLGSYCISRN